MRKALIITYYWPPSGGSGVQRWLKFAKYLRNFGWEPIIYTPINPEVSSFDDSLQKDIPQNLTVIHRRILEPYGLFRFMTRRNGNFGAGFTTTEQSGKSWLTYLSVWIRGNMFIPDPRIWWVKPSVRFLTDYLSENRVDAIITTGPPHSMHLVGLGLKKKIGITWIADFRDPWTNIDFFDDLKLSRRSRRVHCRMEKEVVEASDAVVVVSPQMRNDFKNYQAKHIEVITNGFDEDDFPTNTLKIDKHFTITHVGSIPPNRNCTALWRGLKSMVDNNSEFASKLSIQLVGSVDASVIADIEANNLSGYCKIFGYLPHSEALSIMQRSQVLLLLINNSPNASGILTGKVYEYLAVNRPILAIAPKGGDLDKLLLETGSGLVAANEDQIEIEENLKWLWQQYQQSFAEFSPKAPIEYSRRNLTEKLTKLLKILTK